MIATSRLFWLLGALSVWGLVAGVFSLALPIWIGALVVLALFVGADFWWLRRCELPDVERELPDSLALGVWSDVSLKLRSNHGQTMKMQVFDKPPTSCRTRELPIEVALDAQTRARLSYKIKANERGPAEFLPPDIRIGAPMGLLMRQVEHGPAQPIRVLPNFKAVSRYVLLATANRVGTLGVRKLRRRGSGMEFSHLRDYRQGDLSRQIDWKASARRNKIIAREYEDERNQQIVFMLDCGRRMRAQDGDLSHFDHCLNATLLLTHVALKQGDSAALSTFGGQKLWVPRQKGPGGMTAVLEKIYDLQTTTAPSDYSVAARRLSALQRRRSLVVLLTNLYDQDNAELLEAVALLRQRHVVLVVSLREAAVDQSIARSVDDFGAALNVASGHQYLAHREHTHQTLSARGVLLLDTPPEELSVALVNRYLAIKGSGLL